jgi:hypothetical protein
MDVVDTHINQRVEYVFEDWSGSGWKHRFRPVGSKGSESGTFAGSEDDG